MRKLKKKKSSERSEEEDEEARMNVRATESEMEKAEEVGHQQEKNTLTPSVSEIVHDTKPRQHMESMAL